MSHRLPREIARGNEDCVGRKAVRRADALRISQFPTPARLRRNLVLADVPLQLQDDADSPIDDCAAEPVLHDDGLDAQGLPNFLGSTTQVLAGMPLTVTTMALRRRLIGMCLS